MNIFSLAAIKEKILRFIITQLFLTLVSLPILVAWGLPISALSPVGNLIFAPLLTLFLLFASLIFFCELLYLPNTWFVWPLEWITTIWQKLLGTQQITLLYAFAKPPLWVLFIIPIATLCIQQLRFNDHSIRTVLLLSTLFIASIALLKVTTHQTRWYKNLPCNNGNVTLIYDNGKTILIDPGYIGQRPSAPSWISYTLVPEILKQTGSVTIDHCIALQPGIMTFQALTTLCTKMTVKNLYLPYWQGTMTRAAWAHFKKLQEQIKNSNAKLYRIEKYNRIIYLAQNTTLQIKPLTNTLKYHNATYPATAVTAQIDNESFTLYAAQHAKQAVYPKK